MEARLLACAACHGRQGEGTKNDYFPRLAEVADKVLYGSDWPSPGVKSMAANLRAFRALELPPPAFAKILEVNPARVFT